jgi:hypothetical protein
VSDPFEKRQKRLYKKLQPVWCPALEEMVYFNADGLHHLMYKDGGRRPRTKNEQMYRLSLIPYITEVLSGAQSAELEIKSHDPPILTWSLEYPIFKDFGNGRKCPVKVIVIRKKNDGRLYFLSVMCKGKCKK